MAIRNSSSHGGFYQEPDQYAKANMIVDAFGARAKSNAIQCELHLAYASGFTFPRSHPFKPMTLDVLLEPVDVDGTMHYRFYDLKAPDHQITVNRILAQLSMESDAFQEKTDERSLGRISRIAARQIPLDSSAMFPLGVRYFVPSMELVQQAADAGSYFRITKHRIQVPAEFVRPEHFAGLREAEEARRQGITGRPVGKRAGSNSSGHYLHPRDRGQS